jgi:cytochrome b involved in lipid metabolism
MSSVQYFTRSQVSKNNHEKSMWIIIDFNVYDVTTFIDQHPGGYQSIWNCAGDDATNDFVRAGHSKHAKKSMQSMKIGQVIRVRLT